MAAHLTIIILFRFDVRYLIPMERHTSLRGWMTTLWRLQMRWLVWGVAYKSGVRRWWRERSNLSCNDWLERRHFVAEESREKNTKSVIVTIVDYDQCSIVSVKSLASCCYHARTQCIWHIVPTWDDAEERKTVCHNIHADDDDVSSAATEDAAKKSETIPVLRDIFDILISPWEDSYNFSWPVLNWSDCLKLRLSTCWYLNYLCIYTSTFIYAVIN